MADAVSAADSVISVIAEMAIEGGEAALIAQFPFLGIPPISWIFKWLVRFIAQPIIDQLRKSASIQIIDFGEDKKNASAKEAKEKLKEVLDNEKSSASEVENAKDDFKARYADLVRFRTSHAP